MKKVAFLHFDSLESTNRYALEEGHTFDPKIITVVYTDLQTKGHGRFGRVWQSGERENITATFFFRIAKNSPVLGNTAQVLILSLVNVLQDIGLNPYIKWPNDVLLNGKKCAGALSEVVYFEEDIGLAVGLGLNVNTNKLDLPFATSLFLESGKRFSCRELIQKIAKKFAIYLERLEKEGFSSFAEILQSYLQGKGERVLFFQGDKRIEGVLVGVSARGELLLDVEKIGVQKFSSGELSSKR